MFRVAVGELKHLVTIEQRDETERGPGGEVVEVWPTYATVWCKILPGRGRESEIARRETGKTENLFWCRYLAGVENGMRLKFGARIFDITNTVNIEEASRWLEISAMETK